MTCTTLALYGKANIVGITYGNFCYGYYLAEFWNPSHILEMFTIYSLFLFQLLMNNNLACTMVMPLFLGLFSIFGIFLLVYPRLLRSRIWGTDLALHQTQTHERQKTPSGELVVKKSSADVTVRREEWESGWKEKYLGGEAAGSLPSMVVGFDGEGEVTATLGFFTAASKWLRV